MMEHPCVACVGLADASADKYEQELREQLDLSVRRLAVLSRAPVEAVRRAAAVAMEFATPQRALTCAVLGRRVEALWHTLPPRDAAVLDSMTCRGARGVFGKPTLAPVPDDAFRVALRAALNVRVLQPSSVPCRASGRPCRSRALREEGDERAADYHALTCKIGGLVHRAHNHVRRMLAGVVRSWGVQAAEETGEFLPPDCKMRMDLLLRAGRGLMAVDFTRRVDAPAAALAAAERAKVQKYAALYAPVAVVEVCGFAFDQRGRLGPGARAVMERLVTEGVRATGAHEDDLRDELFGVYSAAVYAAMAAQFAHVGFMCADRTSGVPMWDALVRAGPRRVAAARGRFG